MSFPKRIRCKGKFNIAIIASEHQKHLQGIAEIIYIAYKDTKEFVSFVFAEFCFKVYLMYFSFRFCYLFLLH